MICLTQPLKLPLPVKRRSAGNAIHAGQATGRHSCACGSSHWLLRLRNVMIALFVLPASAAAAGSTASAQPAARPVDQLTIGIAAPLTGRYAPAGRQLAKGARAGIAHINASGGIRINGQRVPLKPELEDDRCDARAALLAAGRLTGNGAALVIGHLCASASIAAARHYAANSTIQISPATRHAAFTDARAGAGIFRLAGRDDQQGAIAGRFLASRYRGQRIALVHDRTLAGMALITHARNALLAGGTPEPRVLALRPGETEYRRLIDKLKRLNIKVLYIATYPTEIGIILRAIEAAGLSITVMTSDAFIAAANGPLTARLAEGLLLTRRPEKLRAAEQPVQSSGRSIPVASDDPVFLAAYAAVEVWAQAVEQAGTTAYATVAAVLAKKNFKTVLGALSFNNKGDADIPSYAVYSLHNGRLILLDY